MDDRDRPFEKSRIPAAMAGVVPPGATVRGLRALLLQVTS